MNDFIREVKYFVPIITIVLSIIAAAFFIANELSRYSCKKTTEIMQINSKYTIATGCMVETKDGWITDDMYRYTIGELK